MHEIWRTRGTEISFAVTPPPSPSFFRRRSADLLHSTWRDCDKSMLPISCWPPQTDLVPLHSHATTGFFVHKKQHNRCKMKAFIALHLWAAEHKVNRHRQQGGPFLLPTQSWSRVYTAYTATWKYIISNTSNYYSDFMLFPKTTSCNSFTFIFEPPITLPPIAPQ